MPIDETKLDILADVGVKVGLGLQPGQQLVISAPADTLPMVRRIAKAAYRAGASVVTPNLADDEITLARLEHGDPAYFDTAANWMANGMAEAAANNAAFMRVAGGNPMLMSGQDPAAVGRIGKAAAIASKPMAKYISGFEVNWSIVAYPTPEWAALVFPDLPEEEAVVQLAEAIFAASRINGADPVADWDAHVGNLMARRAWLNAQRFDALHFTGPGTDLMVGLADDHEWLGGAVTAKNGITCQPNIPTEEVFTTPHKDRVNGHVRASKPLANNGSLIDGIEVNFQGGRITHATAKKGEEAFSLLLDSDEGARRLGEVALVPHSSPISASGLLFYSTLFDENAACHIALGRCYSECFLNSDTLTPEQIADKGGNDSVIHVDWMIGNADMDIDGVAVDGTRTPVFRKGEWA